MPDREFIGDLPPSSVGFNVSLLRTDTLGYGLSEDSGNLGVNRVHRVLWLRRASCSEDPGVWIMEFGG